MIPGPANVGKIVYFDFDSLRLNQNMPVIDGYVRYLNARKNLKITVEGHTDSSVDVSTTWHWDKTC
ncbi:MAG: hypothetical protein IPH40_06855 [Polaromonas sp.]|nr:hypothetical protein [Polaromonas sp.]